MKYKEILQEIDKLENNTFAETILLDINRTPFDQNVEEKRGAIFNILKACAYKNTQINYCQGMNYIAAFLYQLTNDEEEAFYLLYGILANTEYGEIYQNELYKLKQFFYVFERLLFIYIPDLNIYFKNNAIIVSYFISPWFITLFTNCYQYVSDNSNPKILIRIWDSFYW